MACRGETERGVLQFVLPAGDAVPISSHEMDRELAWIAEVSGAREARRAEHIQSLWGGYGELLRVRLVGGNAPSVVLKCIKPPAESRSSSLSDARKRRSYEVETTWYRDLAARCDATCRVPKLIGTRVDADQRLLVLEDLDAAGFTERGRRASGNQLERCLAWLASFHARFLGVAPVGLWTTGTYWHLETRPDELARIDDDALREAAPILDERLRTARFQTLVHGDAKEANFCFSRDSVAAVDFQYVGGGSGMKDVAYLLSGTSVDESRHLDLYFAHLRRALAANGQGVDAEALEAEWRALYPIAAADFYRFLAGWAKPHWQRDDHGQRVVREVIARLFA